MYTQARVPCGYEKIIQKKKKKSNMSLIANVTLIFWLMILLNEEHCSLKSC